MNVNFSFFVFFFLWVPFLGVGQSEEVKKLKLFEGLEMGAFQVGFKTLQSDSMTVHYWYPTKRKKGNEFLMGDYISRTYGERVDKTKLLSYLFCGDSLYYKEGLMGVVMEASMNAYPLSKPADGIYPLVLWGVGRETLFYQSVLSEYLTSHGYVVAVAVPFVEYKSPWEVSTGEKMDVLQGQANLLNQTITALNTLPFVDRSKTALISWSYGGESVVLTQQSNPDVDAVIGLGSLNLDRGMYLGKSLPLHFTESLRRCPYLILSESGDAIFNPSHLHPQSCYITMTTLSQGNFNTPEGHISDLLHLEKVQPWTQTGSQSHRGYEALCKITLTYLNTRFYHNDQSFFDAVNTLLMEYPYGMGEVYCR